MSNIYADILVQNALKEKGTLEGKGERVKYNDVFYAPKDYGSESYWCTTFVWWVFYSSGFLKAIWNIHTPSVSDFHDATPESSRGISFENAKPGDLVFYHTKRGSNRHIGIVVKNIPNPEIEDDENNNDKDDKRPYLITIEGNTSKDKRLNNSGNGGSSSSEDNGDGVFLKKRFKEKEGKFWITDIVRPQYNLIEGIPPVGQPMPDFPLPSGWVFAKGGYQSYNGITDDWGPYIEFIQEALNLTADGRFGEATHQAVLAFQAQRGLSQDGKVGRNTWNALREKRDGGSSSGGSSSGYDDGSTYTGAFKLPSGHCYGKLGIAYASHNGHENASDRPAIRGIQRKLGLSADGLFGNGTHNAVVSFQTKYGLTADGKVGPSTWRSIIFNTDGGSVYGGNSFLLPRGHCYGKLGIKYASHNGYENSSDRPAIRKIQQRLGLYSDGLFGSGTHSAVVAFQRSRGLTADGKVGPGTWNKMF